METNPFPLAPSGWSHGWAARLIQRLNGVNDFLKGDFLPISRLVTRSGRNKGITFVTAATHAASQNEEMIDVNYAGAVTVTLLEAPDFGTFHVIYDSSGAAATNNITIARSGAGLINGVSTSLTINTNYHGYMLIFNGTTWIAFAL